jgi:hypothetical protein
VIRDDTDDAIPRARLDIENDNLLTVETVVARQLGEPVRWHYTDTDASQDPPRRLPGYYMRITGDPMHGQ